MESRYERSYSIFETARRIIPGGVSKARVPHVPGRYPIYMQRASGSHVWDVDGNEYIDWMSGYGCIILGHAHEEVDHAVVAQMKQGFISLLSHPIQNTLAETLIELMPCAEMVYFMKTGTDAASAAVRIARIYTGRDMVGRWGYHGWSDWSLATIPDFSAGVPQSTKDLVRSFDYNDLESLRQLFEQWPNQVACVIMMPFELDLPNPGFLAGVKALCEENGAVLIFDEMRSGFRVSLGGAQEYLGVTPHLAVVSKAMANGYAISAVLGQREVMRSLEKGLFSTTFFVSSLEMAASLATINVIRRDDVIGYIWEKGGTLLQGLAEICSGTALDVEPAGVPPMPFLRFQVADKDRDDRVKLAFYAEAARLGVYLHPNHHWFVNFSHTDEDVARTLEVCQKAMRAAEAVA